jgi:hypothetical protein
MPPVGDFCLDLVDQDHRVADDHAQKRDAPEDGAASKKRSFGHGVTRD